MCEVRDPAAQCGWPDCVYPPLLTCGSCGICRSKECQKLHWKAGHRKGRVDFPLFNVPEIAKVLLPLDNESNHGGVGELIRRLIEGKIDVSKDSGRLHRILKIKPRGSGGTAGLQEYYLNREICVAMFTFSSLGNHEDFCAKSFQKLLHLVGSTLFDP
jgi:hypothetical protein